MECNAPCRVPVYTFADDAKTKVSWLIPSYDPGIHINHAPLTDWNDAAEVNGEPSYQMDRDEENFKEKSCSRLFAKLPLVTRVHLSSGTAADNGLTSQHRDVGGGVLFFY